MPSPPHYLKQWRKYRGLTQPQVAAALEAYAERHADKDIARTQASVARHERGDSKYHAHMMETFAEIYQTTPDALLRPPPVGVSMIANGDNHNFDTNDKNHMTFAGKGVNSRAQGGANYPLTRMVHIVGTVQAGAFMEVSDFEFIDENTEIVPFYDRRHERNTIRALKIVGPSINEVYPDGTTVFIAPVAEVGLREKQFVVARQFDAAGKAETTIKQLVRNGDRLELRPRSTDPRYQDAIPIPARNETAQDGLHIEWVVVGAYQPAEVGEGALVFF